MPFSKQLSPQPQRPYNLSIKEEQPDQQDLIKIIQNPLKESQVIYNQQALQQNKRTILQSIKNTEDIILNSKRFLQTIPAFNCQKIKNHSPDRNDSQNRQSFKKQLRKMQNSYQFVNTFQNRNDNSVQQYQSKKQSFFNGREIQLNNNTYYTQTIKKKNNFLDLNDQYQKYDQKQGTKYYGSFTPRSNLITSEFQKQENYIKAPASTTNRLSQQIKYFKKKVKILEEIKQKEASQNQQIKRQLFPIKNGESIKKTFNNKYSQKFNKQVNLYMEKNLQININYHESQRQSQRQNQRQKLRQKQRQKEKIQEKKELYYKHLKLQSAESTPSIQGHVKKAISPFVNLKNKPDVQNKQIQAPFKKTFINKSFINSNSQMQSSKSSIKQYLNSTLSSPKVKNSQINNSKEKSFNSILIKDRINQKQKQQKPKPKYIQKHIQAKSDSENKIQEEKKTLSEKINEQLYKLQKLNSVQRELGKRRLKERSLQKGQRQKSKQKLNFKRFNNNSKKKVQLQNSVESKQSSPTKSGRKRKLIFEKSTPKEQKSKQKSKKKEESSPQKKRISKMYENQVNSHNQTIQSKIYQFIIEQESKSNRSIEKKKKALSYKKKINNQSPTKNFLTSSKLASSRQSLGKCPYHGNKSFRNDELYSSLDKKKVQQIIREELQIAEEDVIKDSSRFTKLQQNQIRDQIKKIKDYEFIQRYFNNYQLEQILKDFIHRSIPCRKWALIIIDQVYKKIRAKQQLNRH